MYHLRTITVFLNGQGILAFFLARLSDFVLGMFFVFVFQQLNLQYVEIK